MNLNFWKRYLKEKGLAAVVLKANGRVLELLYPVLAVTCPFKIRNNKVLFFNFSGKGYGANPRYICEELRKSSDYDLVWVTNSSEEQESVPSGVRTVKLGSFQYNFDMLTAKVWINNIRFDSHIRKRIGQYYIQTWHGGIALKKVEKDAVDSLPNRYLSNAKNDSHMADLFLSNSKWTDELYRRAFWYNGDIMHCGFPREDIFFHNDDEKTSEIKNKLGVKESTRILLYAPTFRKEKKEDSLEVYKLDWNQVLLALKKKFDGEWIGMIRLHPNVANLSDKLSVPSSVMNVTDYPDMQELLLVTDCLVTDYSSCIIDYSFTNKMGFLYATDMQEYMADRNFYFNLADLPFGLTQNTEELIAAIMEYDDLEYKNRLRKFQNKLGLYKGGHAAKSVAAWIRERTA